MELSEETPRFDKIMLTMGRKDRLMKNYNLIRMLDILIIKENKGLDRSKKIFEIIEKELKEKGMI